MNELNVSKLTKKYISEHPSVKDCLRRGLVNYSALSRDICSHEKIKNFDAVLVACRRYRTQIREQQLHEKKIIQLVRGAQIQIKNKVVVAIIEKPRDFERLYLLQKAARQKKADFTLIEGDEAVVIVTNSDYSEDIRDAFRGRILKITPGLVQVHMLFSEKIETTPGVVSFIYGLLAEHNINVLEEMSCWTDLMIVVSEDDAARVLKALRV